MNILGYNYQIIANAESGRWHMSAYGYKPQDYAVHLFKDETSGKSVQAYYGRYPAPVPLPASALLLLGGAGALGALRIRSRSAS